MQEEKRFTHQDKDYVLKPVKSKDLAEGRKLYAKSFRKAIENGAILKKSLDDHMRRQGLWDDQKQDEYTGLIKRSADLEYRIKSGQFKKASELKDKALELKSIRDEVSDLMAVRNSMDSVTAEGQAEQEQFNYFIYCSVHDYLNQKTVFSSFDDYLDKADTDFGRAMANKFAAYFYDVSEDFEDSLLENKVLKKLDLIDKDGFLVDSEGRRVDLDGNLINEEGARIDNEGQRIDINNNPILDDSFLDDLEIEDDLKPKSKKKAALKKEPVVEKEPTVEKEKPKRKRKPSKATV